MTDDPKRLFEDPTASAAVRADLARALAAPPPAYDVERGLAGVLAATSTGVPAAAGTFAKLLKWLPWGAGSVLVLGAVGGSLRVVGTHARPSLTGSNAVTSAAGAPAPSAPEMIASAPEAIPSVVEARGPEPSAVIASPVIAQRSAAPRHHGPPTREAPALDEAPPSAVAEAPAPPDNAVVREVALVGRARAALASNPAQALALAQAGDSEFPRGVLREERHAIAVLALMRLGRGGEANARGRAFLAQYPKGPFSERVRLAVPDAGQGKGGGPAR